MTKIIGITSAKGGVGSSTISSNLAKIMADKNEKTILIETDSGLRNLDISLNVKDIIYDLGDYLNKNCSLKDVIKKTQYNNLFLLPAPFNFNILVKQEDVYSLCHELKQHFDNIILDLKMNFEIKTQTHKILDFFLFVVTPDAICVRNTVLFINFLKFNENDFKKTRLIINKLEKKFIKNSQIKSLDDIIDETKLQLLGIIPFSKKIQQSSKFITNIKNDKTLFKIFTAIASRLNDENVNLILR